MRKTITVFRGDGIGPELTDAVMKILKAANAPLDYEIFEVGEAEWKRNGELIPARAYASFEKNRVLLKAPITTPVGKGFRSLNVRLRKKYQLYANIRPIKSNVAVKTPYPNVDLVIFRENTEGMYAGLEQQLDENTVHAIRLTTRPAVQRIIRAAFGYARAHKRKKVTCVHKANIIKLSEGMILSEFRKISKEYPEIIADDKIVENCCMQMVMRPEQFDVMVMENLFGDILSDLGAGLIGGLGLVPSANIGDGYAMFEAVHGSAPDIAGQNKANPTALCWAACMLLEYLGDGDCAARIRAAVDNVLKEGLYLTADLGGTAGTNDYVDHILRRLSQ